MLNVPIAFFVFATRQGPAITVDLTAPRHPISPLIYGMNDNQGDVDPGLAKELKLPVSRWGGDATTRYNWLNDATNAGFDWYFTAGSANANPTPGASSDAFVARANLNGRALLTIPIIDYINKATTWDCSYPVSIFGPQQSVNPYVKPTIGGVQTQAGNGFTPSGTQLTLTTDQILRLHVPNSPTLARAWIRHLTAKFGSAKAGGVAIYQLDNEPTGWSNTHRDIHPNTPTYQEIVEKGTAYAKAIKAEDPTAAVLGPGDFGYPAYLGKPDQNGGLWNSMYYLQQMQIASKAAKTRLLDYFDEHYYPISDDGIGAIALGTAGNAATQENRIRSTRSLWDPTYVEKDWIGKWHGAIALIPSMHSWVKTYYPGTKLAITEYNFGGLESINGAIVQGDVLGIFGRESLDLATLWGVPKPTQPGAFAFRMYRNFDGKHGSFGDTSVSATSTDPSVLSVYAATRSADRAVTVMVINKTSSPVDSTLRFVGSVSSTAVSYSYSEEDLAHIVRGPEHKLQNGTLTMSFPPNSMTMLVF